MTTLDVAFARAQFPALGDPDLDGWAFFENAGGSYACRQVVDLLTGYYTRTKVQPHHPYPLAQAAGAAMDAGPAALARWLGVPADHVHVGPSTTQHTYVLERAFEAVVGAGDAVVVTEQDHEANSGAWRRLAERVGAEVREWRVDRDTGRLDTAALTDLLDERVALVTFPHASNLVGEPHPVRAWCDLAREAGALTVVDGVAAAPHGLPDVTSIGCDVYLFSTYKTFGPHQGVLVAAPDLVERLPNQGHFFNAGTLAKRLVPAGPDHAQVAATAGVAAYLDLLDAHHFGDAPADDATRIARLATLLQEHERRLVAPLLAFLDARDDVRLVGPSDPSLRHPTVSFVAARPGAEVAADLAGHRVMAAGGHFYAHRLVSALGVDPAHGVVRASFVHTATEAEVTQLVEALDAVL
jgi:selenocysteine lyase/cysteine desulfurase